MAQKFTIIWATFVRKYVDQTLKIAQSVHTTKTCNDFKGLFRLTYESAATVTDS